MKATVAIGRTSAKVSGGCSGRSKFMQRIAGDILCVHQLVCEAMDTKALFHVDTEICRIQERLKQGVADRNEKVNLGYLRARRSRIVSEPSAVGTASARRVTFP